MKKIGITWFILSLTPFFVWSQNLRTNIANIHDPRVTFLSSSAIPYQQNLQFVAGYEIYFQGLTQDALRNGFSALAFPAGKWGSFGFHGQYFSAQIFQQTNFTASYARSFFNQKFSFGFDFGLLNFAYNRDNFQLDAQDDPVFSHGLSKNLLDLGASVLINPIRKLFIGMAVKHLNQANASLINDEVNFSPNMFLGAVFYHPIVSPLVNVEYLENRWYFDLGLEKWLFNQHAMLRFNYSRLDADFAAAYLLASPHHQLRFDYKYKYPLSDLNRISNGYHQFMITYGLSRQPWGFDLEVVPNEQIIQTGETANYTIKIKKKGGFDQPVKLRTVTKSPLIFSSLYPSLLIENESSDLTLTASSRCLPGKFVIDVHGWYGTNEKSYPIVLEVKRRSGLFGKITATVDTLVIRETTRELSRNPLLPYIFFDENKSELPVGRYEIMNPDKYPLKKFVFSSEKLLDIHSQYKNTLNIIAQRLWDNSQMKIKICGYNSGWGVEKDNLKLSRKRAEAVKDYFVNNCCVHAEQLFVEAFQMPPDPASNSDPRGREENRRVEIIALPGSESILDPIITETTSISSSDSLCFFRLNDLIADAGLKSWKILVMEAPDDTFKIFRGQQFPKGEIFWNWKNDSQRSVQVGKDYRYQLLLQDNLGNKYSSKWKNIHVKQVSESKDEYVEKNIERTRLILFKYDRSNMEITSPLLQQEIENIIRKMRMDLGASLLINGHTDIIGEPEYNMILSFRRAKTVAEYFISKGISESRVSYGGFGFSKPLLSNYLPEGRMINRRVEMSVWYSVGASGKNN